MSANEPGFPLPINGRARDAICSSKMILVRPLPKVRPRLASSEALPPADKGRGDIGMMRQNNFRVLFA